ncbi:hypothetical protein RHMOL_Rhmol07G0049800 [Rhododendron molle]|uniref:Uncharacterized protein n=1 Tax=Rhododendron molle TaxID=49168 RepID=A0ACC0MZ61_RHOML|nr:hypothetical protein RHMOL_Rhmol07G0049800 [Rhododendron molle]
MNAPWEEVARVEVFLNSNNCAISFACGTTHSFFLFYATQVETAQPLSKLGLDFPDLSIGCYRESRYGSLVISFRGNVHENSCMRMSFILKDYITLMASCFFYR